MVSLCAPRAVQKTKRLIMNVANQPVNLALISFLAGEYAKALREPEAKDGTAAVHSGNKPPWVEAQIQVPEREVKKE